MPCAWTETADTTKLVVTPHQSLTPRGFVWFMGVTLVMIAMPLLAVLGTPVLWGLLPFFALAIWGLWLAIGRNQRDARLSETLTLSGTRITLVRRDPRGEEQRWEANPYWVSVQMHAKGGPVENYVTLKGAGREVEIGAFLSADERVALFDRLELELVKAKELRADAD
jgi:uncharacterized membrane protein